MVLLAVVAWITLAFVVCGAGSCPDCHGVMWGLGGGDEGNWTSGERGELMSILPRLIWRQNFRW